MRLAAREPGADDVLATSRRRVTAALAHDDGNGSERHHQRGDDADEPDITTPDAPPEALALRRHR